MADPMLMNLALLKVELQDDDRLYPSLDAMKVKLFDFPKSPKIGGQWDHVTGKRTLTNTMSVDLNSKNFEIKGGMKA